MASFSTRAGVLGLLATTALFVPAYASRAEEGPHLRIAQADPPATPPASAPAEPSAGAPPAAEPAAEPTPAPDDRRARGRDREPMDGDRERGPRDGRRGDRERPRGGEREADDRERRRREGARQMGPFAFPFLCGPQFTRMTDMYLARIEQAVRPTDTQRAAFNDLRQSVGRAGETIRTSCDAEPALTPTGRLEAIERRLDAVLTGVRAVRGPLDTFYGGLTDEQKARFNQAGAMQPNGPESRPRPERPRPWRARPWRERYWR